MIDTFSPLDSVENLRHLIRMAGGNQNGDRLPYDLLGEAIVAFVVPIEGADLTPKEVMKICHEHLPRFKMPGHVRIVNNLPRTKTGKLRRNELKEWFAQGMAPKGP